VLVRRPSDNRPSQALHGLTPRFIANMVECVTAGFKKTLEIQGVGNNAEAPKDGVTLSG